MTEQLAHPMVKFQSKVTKLVASKVLKPNDKIWKVAFLYGDQWDYWKGELLEFGFTMQDPVSELLLVEAWDED
ncbi:MAG TPA: DUF4327 domain-containing protein [Cyanothece sp. UBA12306]|nr:DUF4327 domain-containing protein [Cyanothece sp. UBA12306]